MNKFKVVIVDDEILAIHYLKNLICWEDYGFEVVGESSNPEKALTQPPRNVITYAEI